MYDDGDYDEAYEDTEGPEDDYSSVVHECSARDVAPGFTVLDAYGQPFEVYDVEEYSDGTLRLFGDSTLTVPPEAIVQVVSVPDPDGYFEEDTMVGYSGPAQTRLAVSLARVLVPKHERVVGGKTQSVDTYTYERKHVPGSPGAQMDKERKKLSEDIKAAHAVIRAEAEKRSDKGWEQTTAGAQLTKGNAEVVIELNARKEVFEALRVRDGETGGLIGSAEWGADIGSLFDKAESVASAKAGVETDPYKREMAAKAGKVGRLEKMLGRKK